MNHIMISVSPYLLTAEATVQTAIDGWDVHTVIDWIMKLKDKLSKKYNIETLRVYACFSDVVVSGENETVFAIIAVMSRFVNKYGDAEFRKND